jgi:hypothetical protein
VAPAAVSVHPHQTNHHSFGHEIFVPMSSNRRHDSTFGLRHLMRITRFSWKVFCLCFIVWAHDGLCFSPPSNLLRTSACSRLPNLCYSGSRSQQGGRVQTWTMLAGAGLKMMRGCFCTLLITGIFSLLHCTMSYHTAHNLRPDSNSPDT